MKSGRLLVLLASLLTWLPSWAAAPVVLDHSREELAGHLDILIDASKSMRFEEVSSRAGSERFVPLKGELNEGLLKADVWLRFDARRAPRRQATWLLEVQPATLEHLTLYMPNPDGSYSLREAGMMVPFAQREVAYKNPVFRLSVPITGAQTFYLKIRTHNTVAARLTLWLPSEFVAAVGREQMMLGLFLGVYGMLMLASLWFELAVRDGVYRAFGIYVFSSILLTLGETGLLYQYIFPNHPEWAEPMLGLAFAFSMPACIDFLFRFLGMPQLYPRLSRRYVGAVRLYALVLAIAILMGHNAAAMANMLVVVTFLVAPLTFGVLLKPALKSTSEIRYAFFITGVLLFAGLFVRFLQVLGYVERSGLTEYSVFISSMVFFLIVYYAISRRYYALRTAKDQAQKQLLAMSQRAEQELEREVAARTDDLLQAMKTVETALSHERAAYEEQRQFIATVSHELRTPLAVIDATTQNLSREALNGNASVKTQARLEKIRQATDRLSSLFDNYLSSNRLDIFSYGVRAEETLLLPLLEDAIVAAQPLADGHVFVLNQESVPEFIWGDRDLLRLSLRTLADNAVKYTQPEAEIRVTALTAEDGWTIDFADNGPGIPPEERALIFERYYRGRAVSGQSGTGLGLALAKRLIEMHKGTLTLLDTDDPGSTFRIWLPRPMDGLRG
ncbi:sensor histidine kinase [Herbaspirillum rhizosphaerae]|uniref:sensor histidine kinase n=1 Tax=Herbaspirillum rhizosphaerae TaxID=346179 RepID=UPI00142F3820|nr:sensor histidine kinase [Herbaspirillum rhizosphaerae]